MPNFYLSKFSWKKYVETTWIFRPSKLHRKKYVEITWISRSFSDFSTSKIMWKWHWNSSKFGLRRIDVVSTSNRRRFDVVCLLRNFYEICKYAINGKINCLYSQRSRWAMILHTFFVFLTFCKASCEHFRIQLAFAKDKLSCLYNDLARGTAKNLFRNFLKVLRNKSIVKSICRSGSGP